MKHLFSKAQAIGVIIFSVVAIVVLPYLNALIDPSFSQSDFKDVPGMATKLSVHADTVTAFVWKQITPDNQQRLLDPAAPMFRRVTVLTECFNKLLFGEPLNVDNRFAGVKLSPETMQLNPQNPATDDIRWLNRKLLEDAFPAELKTAHLTRLPSLLQIDNFSLNLYGKYICYAMLAIGVDMLWGYTGLLSLGLCVAFALGGYMIGMYLMRMIGDMGQYHKPIPDFLVFLGWSKLPWFWNPFSSFAFATMMVFLLPGVVGLVFGYLVFRSRIKGVYFSIMLQAFTYVGRLLFFQNNIYMGGNNGFTDYKFLLGYDLRLPSTQRALYICSAIALLCVYLLCKWLTTTKFGKIQRAIRDSENRLLFSGYATANYKLFIFVLTSLIAAVAGMLYVPQVGIINPGEMEPSKSVEAVIWVAVGGRGTLVGPVIGAVFVNGLKSWATSACPDLWPIILGAFFIFVVLFMPKGLVGLFGQARALFDKRVASKPAPEEKMVAPTGTTTVVTKADV